ncbi:MAG: hypothetical protein NC311_13355 [Muribaculaceae bacterium]|nr:hypothetical protein [Muribaculaceae bacterium]
MGDFDKYDNYLKNRQCLEQVIGRIMSEMSGHGAAITDLVREGGRTSHSKAESLACRIMDAYEELCDAKPGHSLRAACEEYLYLAIRAHDWNAILEDGMRPRRKPHAATFQHLIDGARAVSAAARSGQYGAALPGLATGGLEPENGRQKPAQDLQSAMRQLAHERDQKIQQAQDEYDAAVKALREKYTADNFEAPDEYARSRDSLLSILGQEPDIAMALGDIIEQAADAFLFITGKAPACDTDMTLDVYSRIYDSALAQAKRYEEQAIRDAKKG